MLVNDLFEGPGHSVISGNERILHQFYHNSVKVTVSVGIVNLNIDSYGFSLKTDISFEFGQEGNLTLRATSATYRICGGISLVRRNFLSKRFADQKWSRIELLSFWLIVVDEVGYQLVFDFSVVVWRFEGPREIFREFDAEGVGILSFFEMLVVVFLENVLGIVESIAAC